MVERGEIVKLWRNRRQASGVLATVVRVEGSSYRRPGARMCTLGGSYAGSISGGCLEGEVVRKAEWFTRSGAMIQRFSTLFDNPVDETGNVDAQFGDHQEIPYGLGCGGVIDILLEPTASPETEALLLAFEAAQEGETFSSATVLPASGATAFARVIAGEGDAVAFASAELDGTDIARLSKMARGAESAKIVAASVRGQFCDVFLEPIAPPQRLVIFGAGEDARPLARLAHLMGWRVWVADGRAWLAQPARFPEAQHVVALEAGDSPLEVLKLTGNDAAAMLTHSFQQDRDLLPQLLPLGLRYLGLLGARHRSRLLLTQAAEQLGWSIEECLRRVHAPIGLDLGGDSPEAVALTIVAEIQSVLNAKKDTRRDESNAGLLTDSARTYYPAQCPLDEIAGPTVEPSDASRPS